jgi:hypothetical protein
MSIPRYCEFWKASNGKWYLDLAVHEEYDEEEDHGNPNDGSYEDSVTYGPFNNENEVDQYLLKHSNPGSFYTDSSGKRPPPIKSPNGSPVVSPSAAHQRSMMSVVSKPVRPTPLKPEIPTKTYKVYGKKTIRPFHNQTTKVVPVHTRIKGKAYGPIDKTRFKKDDQVSVIVPKGVTLASDNKTPRQIAVNDPEFKGANQYWNVDHNDVKESILRQFIRNVLIAR